MMSRPRWPDSHNPLSEVPGTVQDVLLSKWKKGANPVLHQLRVQKLAAEGQKGWWKEVQAKEVFGRDAAARQGR